MARLKKGRKKIPPHAYDSTLKEWVQQQPQQIIPLLLEGATYEETCDSERIRPTMRTDRVFKIMYRSGPHILNLEFESGTDTDLVSRLLVYHAILYQEYGLPVISIIIYPFRVTPATPPWYEMSGDEIILMFNFRTLPLYDLHAEQYLRQHLACMYPLLPAMQGITVQGMMQAMEELAELYREDEVTLAQQFVWMALLLERTQTISSLEKREIQRRLSMYDPLWEDHPKVKQIRAESRKEGEVRALRRALLTIINMRFPSVAELAKERAAKLDSPDALDLLMQQISRAPDEKTARSVLELIGA